MSVAAPAQAGVDISFGIRAPIGSDNDLYFNIASRYYDRPVPMVSLWGRRLGPDDLAVFLHICRYSRVSPDTVYAWRRQGMSWFDVGHRAGMPVDAWYIPVRHQPGPPYGKAYGYWDKHRRNPNYRIRLTDRQARDLVAVRMAHEYYGVPPQVAMDWRRSGTQMNVIMTREYHSRHRHDNDRADRHDRDGRDHDRDHDRYDDRDHDRYDDRDHRDDRDNKRDK
jgi:hypothetical protein